jgi:RimJ/RimL family protein N-acetyltransferase
MLEGTIVNLRAPEMSDLERNLSWMNDREVTRFLAARYQLSHLAEENWMREHVSKPMTYNRVFFAIETKDGEHIGNTDLINAQPEERKCELGIMIGDKRYWSKGCGTDAVRTLLAFAFDEMNMNRVQLHVYDFNERAQAAYVKAGFVVEGRRREAIYTEGAYHDTIVMSALRDEWNKTR